MMFWNIEGQIVYPYADLHIKRFLTFYNIADLYFNVLTGSIKNIKIFLTIVQNISLLRCTYKLCIYKRFKFAYKTSQSNRF